MIKDFHNIDQYTRDINLDIDKRIDNYLIYKYQDVNSDAQLTQNTYRHHFYELALEINEGCSFQVDGFNLPLQGKRLTIIAPHRLQSNVLHKNLAEASRGYSVFFERSFFGGHFNETRFKVDYHFLSPNFSPSFNLTDKQLNELINIFNLIEYEQNEYGNNSKETIRNLTTVIFEKTKNLQKYEVKHTGSSALVNQFLELGYSSFLNIHSVKEYASILAVSPKHLTESVKVHTGLTALEFLHNLKVGYAKGLLQQTNLSVKQIAFELGFENPEYFNVFFKKLTGKTPLQFRNN